MSIGTIIGALCDASRVFPRIECVVAKSLWMYVCMLGIHVGVGEELHACGYMCGGDDEAHTS